MKKILVVDDNLDILEIVDAVLAYEHFTVKGLSCSSGFIQIALEFSPDLILLDYRLGDGDGSTLCKQIKAEPALNKVPIIIFSAYPTDNAEIQQSGCDAIISKPFDIDYLVERINELLARS